MARIHSTTRPPRRQSAGGRPGGRPSDRAAFSLLELVVTLVVLAAVAMIAAPRYAHSVVRYRAELAARRVAADLALARAKARETSAAVTVQFALAGSTISIAGIKHLDGTAAAYATDLAGEPYRAQLLSVDFAGQQQVTFDGYGVPASAGTVVVRCGDEQRTVVLNAESGEATVQ